MNTKTSSTNRSKAKELAKTLRNIGPVMAGRLLDVGIDSLEALRELGVEETYLRLTQHPDFCGRHHAAYCYALEGAVSDCNWNALPDFKRRHYQAFTASLRKIQGVAPPRKKKKQENAHLFF